MDTSDELVLRFARLRASLRLGPTPPADDENRRALAFTRLRETLTETLAALDDGSPAFAEASQAAIRAIAGLAAPAGLVGASIEMLAHAGDRAGAATQALAAGDACMHLGAPLSAAWNYERAIDLGCAEADLPRRLRGAWAACVERVDAAFTSADLASLHPRDQAMVEAWRAGAHS